MTRDGVVEVNETQQTAERISSREADSDFSQPDSAAAERVIEHLDAAHTRKANKKAVKKEQEATALRTSTSRLQFTEEELATPELERYIEKSNKAADRLDAAKAAIPKQKKLVKERTFEEAAGKAKTNLRFEEQEKPIPGGKKGNPLSRPAQEAGIFVHNKIHSVEKDNSGVEGAHKSEELAERGAKYGARKLKQGYRSHKLKPYREAAKAEKAAFKANVNFQYHKALQENPQLTSNPFSRFMQKQNIKRQYAKTVKKGGAATAKAAAGASQTAAKKAAAFAGRHPAGVIIAIAALLLFLMVSVGLSSCGAMFSGSMNSVLGTSYTSEDSDLVATEQSYAAMENGLQSEIDTTESTHPGYDEYRYDLDSIGHNPHELASYLTALLQSYTPQSAQAELKRLFGLQYTLTLTEEIEIRTTTDEEGNEEEYEYRILNVKLTNKPITSLAEELLNPQQFEMFKVYLQTQGNKPLIFGGGSPDGSPSEDLSGVEFVNGTRPGNQELMELAKQQVGNVGGYPYWSWYGFNSRVEWCACFVSWCYNQAGKSEPRFAGCEWQGVPWFQSRGQWGARGYENIAPGDAIFFDWDLDGVADHVGLVLGRDESRVYTVEGNSGDACKIKSYDLNYQCIKGYGLMNW
ncbi:CHAP domain-containing protein [[Clostridium] leptum]|jgi:cell wall-associated NlpC family hydrolase|nr:CHAP domain-containing protein [[Clostridium] leptum]